MGCTNYTLLYVGKTLFVKVAPRSRERKAGREAERRFVNRLEPNETLPRETRVNPLFVIFLYIPVNIKTFTKKYIFSSSPHVLSETPQPLRRWFEPGNIGVLFVHPTFRPTFTKLRKD